MTLVILAAGLGSRYGGLKQLDPMTDAGNFIIDFSVYDAIAAGFDHVVFIIKEENLELFRDTIGKRIEKKIKVTYAFQKMDDLPAGFTAPEGRTKPLGTGHAIYCVRNLIKDNFAVINADDFYGRDTFMQLAKHLKDASAENGFAHHCMVGFRLKNTLTENGTVSRGQCFVDEKGMLESVVEQVNKLHGMILKVRSKGRETDAEKLGKALQAKPSEYARAKGLRVNPSGYSKWWLRTFGDEDHAYYISDIGNICKRGFYIYYYNDSEIRPAMYIANE